MLVARSSRGLVAVATSGLVLLACGQIAGIQDPDTTAATVANGDSSVEILPAEGGVTFGSVACGSDAPAAQVISIANKGSNPAEYKVTLPDGTPFRLDGPLEGTIPAGAPAVTIKAFVTPNAPGDATTEVLVSVGPVLKNIPLKATGHGATVTFDPPVAALGDVRMQSGGTIDVLVHNGGTDPLAIVGFDGQTANLTVVGGGAMTVAPGTDQKMTVDLSTDTQPSEVLTAQLVPKIVGTAICGAPGTLSVSGRRVNSDVTLSSGDFGKIACQSAQTKDIVIKNYSGNQLDYTTALSAGSAFTITAGATGTIAKGSNATPQTGTITVAPAAVLTTLGAASDTLTVTISGIAAPSGGPRTVPLSMDVRGAILAVTPNPITDFKRLVNRWGYIVPDARNIAIQNTGNEAVSINWNLKRTAGDPAWVWSNFPGSLAAGQSTTAQVGFQPTGNCPCESTGTPVATAGGPICNALTLDYQGSL